MPMEIEGQYQYRPMPRHMGLGAVPTNPQKMTNGVRVAIRVESNHQIGSEEFALAVLPLLKAQGLEPVGEPKLIVDDSPIWVWQKIAQTPDPAFPEIKEGDYAYMAVLASGPLKGHEGMVMSPSNCMGTYDPKTGEELSWKCEMGTPTVKDTAELPRFVEDWSILARPVDLELAQSKVAGLKEGMRTVRQLLQGLGDRVGTQVTAAEVPAPKPQITTAAKVGTAAIIGIALAMLTWGKKVGA